jgi:cytoskeletal protein CcmA (bactofilin family)
MSDSRGHLRAELNPEFALVPKAGIFEGQIAEVGETRIEGTVLGSLRGPGTLSLGSEARVEGRIECETVSSFGTIMGPIVARKRVHLGDGACFEGDLVAPAIEVDGDVVWNGKARVRP